mgnify:CR=1 FL=1
MTSDPSDPTSFRKVLGRYPTGVCLVTGGPANAEPVGMVVGSFTSVSLNPPLVAFLPARNSTSWPLIEASGAFCVNILGSEQEGACRRFASRASNKFDGLGQRRASSGAPMLDNCLAWLDCTIENVVEAGDHYIALGRVTSMEIGNGRLPLIFYQGDYGSFIPQS